MLSRTTRNILQISARAGTFVPSRQFTQSAVLLARRKRSAQLEADYDIQYLEEYQYDDHTTFGHHLLHQVRQVRSYLRRIKQELPTFKQYVTPYRPPADEQILRFQRIRHLGEEHPLDAKAVMTVKLDALCRVAQLDEKQRHKFILLCASHYNQATGELRFSCERFPTYNQNKRYLSDILDRVLDEVKHGKDMFEDIPVEIVLNPRRNPVEKPKFPLEWLKPRTPEAVKEVEELKARRAMTSQS